MFVAQRFGLPPSQTTFVYETTCAFAFAWNYELLSRSFLQAEPALRSFQSFVLRRSGQNLVHAVGKLHCISRCDDLVHRKQNTSNVA